MKAIKTQGYEFGKRAFLADIGRAFALDCAANEWLESLSRDERVPAMEAWYRGWQDACFDAPVPGFTDEENEAAWRGVAAAKAFMVPNCWT